MPKVAPPVCLACGAPRPNVNTKDLSRDEYDRPMTFCRDYCYERYMKRRAQA